MASEQKETAQYEAQQKTKPQYPIPFQNEFSITTVCPIPIKFHIMT